MATRYYTPEIQPKDLMCDDKTARLVERFIRTGEVEPKKRRHYLSMDRRKAMAYALMDYPTYMTAQEVADRLEISYHSALETLNLMSGEGIIEMGRDGRTLLFRANNPEPVSVDEIPGLEEMLPSMMPSVLSRVFARPATDAPAPTGEIEEKMEPAAPAATPAPVFSAATVPVAPAPVPAATQAAPALSPSEVLAQVSDDEFFRTVCSAATLRVNNLLAGSADPSLSHEQRQAIQVRIERFLKAATQLSAISLS